MKKSKTVLIVGGSGLIGTHLCLKLSQEYKVFATFRNNKVVVPGVSIIPFDVGNRDWVKRVIYTIEPQAVIYVAGKNDLNWAEENQRHSEIAHTGGPGQVSTTADIFKPRFIYVSNAYVFDGKKGNYKEDDIVLPWTTLGKNKLNAENYIRGRSLNHVIIRSAPVFGRGNEKNISFLDHLRIKLQRGEKIELPENELHGFAPVYGLISLIQKLIESGPRNKIIHYGGITKTSFYEFGLQFARRFGFDESNILPVKIAQDTKSKIFHTYDYSLNCSEAVKTLNLDPFVLEKGFDLLEEHLVARP